MSEQKKDKRPKAPARTKAEIAQERLDGATHRLRQKIAKRDRLLKELAETETEIDELRAEVGYLEQNPALPKQAPAAPNDGQPVRQVQSSVTV